MGLSQIAATGASLTSLSFAAATGAAQFLYHDSAHLATAVCISLPSIVAARFGSRLAGKLSGEVHALIFNGLSVLLIPSHFMVQQWRQNQSQKAGSKAEAASGTSMSAGAAAAAAAAAGGGGGAGAGGALAEYRPVYDAQHSIPVAASIDWPTPAAASFDLPPAGYIGKHACFGAVCGLLSALMGVGGLPLTISYLTLTLPDLPHHLVQGTAMCSVLPSVLTSAYVQAKAGHTPLKLAAAVCCGSVLGSCVGAKMALALDEDTLRSAFIASLVVLGGRSFFAASMSIYRIVKARRAAAVVYGVKSSSGK